MIKAFDVPTQDVEVKSITPTADDKAIYLGDSANLQELVHQNATFDGTNNAFVDVTYTVKDENGTVVGRTQFPPEAAAEHGCGAIRQATAPSLRSRPRPTR